MVDRLCQEYGNRVEVAWKAFELRPGFHIVEGKPFQFGTHEIVNSGPVGCELAQCFARFGSLVTLVEMLPRLLIREDPEISDTLLARFRAENIKVLTAHRAVQFSVENSRKILLCANDGGEVRIEFDALLCAVGRVADTSGYGLETLGIRLTYSDPQFDAWNEFLILQASELRPLTRRLHVAFAAPDRASASHGRASGNVRMARWFAGGSPDLYRALLSRS